jgi:type III pantothenate kinase
MAHEEAAVPRGSGADQVLADRSTGAVLVVDVGNTRIKLAAIAALGVDADGRRTGLPELGLRQDLPSRSFRQDSLEAWLRRAAPSTGLVLVASVNDAAADRLEATVAGLSATRQRPLRQRRIAHGDLPLAIAAAEPSRVGIDRLAGAAAAAVLKPARRPAVIVDCGTAMTVDLIDATGRFLGGAILPGPTLMARSLGEGTSRLPQMEWGSGDAAPPMPGGSTQEAIRAGIGLGIRGAVSRLVEAAREALRTRAGPGGGPADDADGEAVCFLTGGGRAAVRDALPGAFEVPDLVLAGIALAASRATAGPAGGLLHSREHDQA